MTEMIVQIEDYSLLSKLKKIISYLPGVINVQIVDKTAKVKKSDKSLDSDLSALVGSVSITESDLQHDDRLAYLIGK
ncbi:MAG: hypothetical protein II670_02500 [Alphaproteobacteria bacterium]|nr:hypothetical protein [Alphaproteobacteria bacterium]